MSENQLGLILDYAKQNLRRWFDSDQHSPSSDEDFAAKLGLIFWEDRENALAWFSAGGPFYCSLSYHQPFRGDRQVFELLIDHRSLDYYLKGITDGAGDLLADKSFMMKAVEKHYCMFFMPKMASNMITSWL
jgi:hypothetical protein